MKKVLAASLVAGVVITLVTGFINTTPSGLLGATWYGWPFAWRIVPVVLNPVANYDIPKLVADIVVWFVVALVILIIIQKFRK
ncbi:MAG: hypothetical protein HXS41_14335 [Theionarchaea archaeon]|nr:hypothetical protein [Theionarchaea archaeon]MBU7001463.1 hypothetical protein [Theionarchaea archaeon]MBU7022229.1 hypothetical protein [Theionarchaea archaeon]MBU7035111.1 hypothetical protein [Theionarchaea archaeon]MBU7040245.1 hypothetical protein [Theionarchaea archaeon]